jgi:hypothetical protein
MLRWKSLHQTQRKWVCCRTLLLLLGEPTFRLEERNPNMEREAEKCPAHTMQGVPILAAMPAGSFTTAKPGLCMDHWKCQFAV